MKLKVDKNVKNIVQLTLVYACGFSPKNAFLTFFIHFVYKNDYFFKNSD